MKTQTGLSIAEQSFLLASMLFARKNLAEILEILPNEKKSQIEQACQKFLSMPQQERITQIILQLRRLLLLPNYKFSADNNWLESNKVKQAINLEPDYIKLLITKKNNTSSTSAISINQILIFFSHQFL